MPKILHILSQIPAHTGSGILFENLVRQCDRAGYSQAAVIGLPWTLRNHPVRGIPQEQIHEVLFETDLLPFKIPGMSDVMPYESTVFSTMSQEQIELYRNRFKEAVSEAVTRFRPDMIIANHLWVVTAAACDLIEELPPGTGRPKLFAVCHGTDLRQMQLSPVMRPYVTAGCRKADGIFSLNSHQAEAIHELYGISTERIHLIGTGYDATVFYRDPATKDRLHKKTELVYAGKLARSKGLNELIQCMHLLDPEVFRLTVAGRGSGSEAEEILKNINGFGPAIRYAGHLPQADLARLFRESDIFVLPSYYEGLPLVVIEALASGMRVVVNELGGLRDWLGDSINRSGKVHYVKLPELIGLDTCAPGAVQPYVTELASVIRSCAAARDESDQENCYRAIEENSWENVFLKMERVFCT